MTKSIPIIMVHLANGTQMWDIFRNRLDSKNEDL